jgi:hypothetical protein
MSAPCGDTKQGRDKYHASHWRSLLQVRAAVDAVIADPNAVSTLRSSRALACLNKLRALRDALRHGGGGGGAIGLDAILAPWTPDDARRARGASGFQKEPRPLLTVCSVRGRLDGRRGVLVCRCAARASRLSRGGGARPEWLRRDLAA